MYNRLYHQRTVPSKVKFTTVAEIYDYYGSRLAYFTFEVPRGQTPSVGDISNAISKKLGLKLDIREYSPNIVFVPVPVEFRGVSSIRVLRTVPE